MYVPSHLFHMLFELFKVSISGRDSAAVVDFKFNFIVAQLGFCEDGAEPSVLVFVELNESHSGAPRDQQRGVTTCEGQSHPR